MEVMLKNYKHHTISTDGVVTNLKTGSKKSTWVSKAGYYMVNIHESGIPYVHYVHRLLAGSFIPNPDNKRTVNHKDGNKLNNCLTNLEWATDSENIKHAYDNSLNYCSTKKISDEILSNILTRFLAGENLTTISKSYDLSLPTISTYIEKYSLKIGLHQKFIDEKVRQKKIRGKEAKHETLPIVMLDINTLEELKTFSSVKNAMRFLGKTTSGPISNVLNGKQKSAYGYKWKKLLSSTTIENTSKDGSE
jgi:hypothetical protein